MRGGAQEITRNDHLKFWNHAFADPINLVKIIDQLVAPFRSYVLIEVITSINSTFIIHHIILDKQKVLCEFSCDKPQN